MARWNIVHGSHESVVYGSQHLALTEQRTQAASQNAINSSGVWLILISFFLFFMAERKWWKLEEKAKWLGGNNFPTTILKLRAVGQEMFNKSEAKVKFLQQLSLFFLNKCSHSALIDLLFFS